jgi:hypothetical protein
MEPELGAKRKSRLRHLPGRGLEGGGPLQEPENGPELALAEFFGPGALGAPDRHLDPQAGCGA